MHLNTAPFKRLYGIIELNVRNGSHAKTSLTSRTSDRVRIDEGGGVQGTAASVKSLTTGAGPTVTAFVCVT